MSAPLRAETFLRELQGAVSSRRLYAPDHPRNVEILDRLEGHVAALTVSRPEFSALSDADRLITDDGLIESHAPVARGIFRALNQRGFDRLTVSRGVTRAELSAFIETIATLESGGAATLTPTTHVVFSRLVRKAAPGGGGLGAWGGGFVSGGGAPLERVWLSVETGPIELDVLERLVLALGHTVSHNRDALIPLIRLQSHDAYTVTHITNVAVLSMALASALGFSAEFVHDSGTAALLHDVGKLKVPPDVLSSPTRLTESQIVLMKRHPEDGARMLMGADQLPELAADRRLRAPPAVRRRRLPCRAGRLEDAHRQRDHPRRRRLRRAAQRPAVSPGPGGRDRGADDERGRRARLRSVRPQGLLRAGRAAPHLAHRRPVRVRGRTARRAADSRTGPAPDHTEPIVEGPNA